MCFFFFFNDTATTEIYTLSLHDALPISRPPRGLPGGARGRAQAQGARLHPRRGLRRRRAQARPDRGRSEEHTSELQSRHISYAVFCLKKKKKLSEKHEFHMTLFTVIR